jgi:4-hydroxy-tetrahydrodipicolinate reductase
MIKVVINGILGRMGTEIMNILQDDGRFQLVGGIDIKQETLSPDIPVVSDPGSIVYEADVIIDFSLPEGALRILKSCQNFQKPLVTGTTGIGEDELEVYKSVARHVPIVQAFNFSVGINLMNRLVELGTKILKDKADIEITEIHHRMKKDAPSGTAMMLAKTISKVKNKSLEEIAQYGRNGKDLSRGNEIGIHALRGGAVIGEHQVNFFCSNENISINHQALSRKLFVDGALLAAEWIVHKSPGLYSMQNVLGFEKM